MPGPNRRKEEDIRAGRFESQMRTSEMQKLKYNEAGTLQSKVYQCRKCGNAFEERSRHCPRCDSRTMGELRPIPEGQRQEAQRKAIERARAKYG